MKENNSSKRDYAKKWINERLVYITENCDLNDKDNKRAFDSLSIAFECLEKED